MQIASKLLYWFNSWTQQRTYRFKKFIYIKAALTLYQYSQYTVIVMKLTTRKITYRMKSKRSMTWPKCSHSSSAWLLLKCSSTCWRMDSNSWLIVFSFWRLGGVEWTASVLGIVTRLKLVSFLYSAGKRQLNKLATL